MNEWNPPRNRSRKKLAQRASIRLVCFLGEFHLMVVAVVVSARLTSKQILS